MSELTPLLEQSEKKQNYLEVVAPAVIIGLSILCLNRFFSGAFFLTKYSYQYLIPIITNVAVESDLLMVLANPILLYFLEKILKSKQDFLKTNVYAFCIAVASNFISFVLMPFGLRHYCGSLSAIIPLSVLIYSTSSNDKIHIIKNISLTPKEILLIIGFWSMLCLRRPPFTFISALISFILSIFVLEIKPSLFIDQHETELSLKKYLLKDKQSESPKPPSAIENMVIPQGGVLSKEDQVRRQRALRAIEERLEAMQGK